MAIPFISVQLPSKSLEVPLDAARAGIDHLVKHPMELVQALRHAAGLKVLVPLDALRWLLAKSPARKGAPKDVVLGTRPPALTVAATIDLMGNAVRITTAVRIEELSIAAGSIRLALRLADFTMDALDANSPVAQFLKSPSLDLSKPANLMGFMPKKPAILVEAKDDRVVLDFMKLRKLDGNAAVKKILAVLTPILTIPDISTEGDNLLIAWRPRLSGLREAGRSLIS